MSLFLGGVADDPLLAEIRRGLTAAGVRVHDVALDPGCDDDAEHEARFLAQLGAGSRAPIVGGFSLGARIAVRIAPRARARAVLCFAFPFHRVGDAGDRHGLAALSRLEVPTRVIQGTRDNHGSEAEVRGYALPPSVEMIWLRDANHRFVPKARSGSTQDALIAAAVASSVAFLEDA